jgi:hypothetical protein
MENDLKKHSLNTGLTLGGILLLISTLIYSIDFKLFLDTYISFFISFIIIACGTYSIFKTKNNNGGTITFGDAFKSYFIATAIGYLIYWIWMFIIYNIIDPEAAIAIDEQAMLMAKEMFESLGVAQEMIAKSMDEMSKNSSFSLSNILATYCFKLIGYSLVGLITSLIFYLLYPHKTEE